MSTHSKAKIFLAEQRGISQQDWFRSYYTFNFRDYFNEHKTACNEVYVCNDDTLAPQKELTMTVAEDSYIILVPVTGDILYQDTTGYKKILFPGSVQLIRTKGLVFKISNLSGSSLVNYLHIWVKASHAMNDGFAAQAYFDPDENKGQLTEMEFGNEIAALPCVNIGKFTGRQEAIYKVKGLGVFIYVIEGAFEVEGRLMHARDGLSLWNDPGEIEMEALSNDAIILIVENSPV